MKKFVIALFVLFALPGSALACGNVPEVKASTETDVKASSDTDVKVSTATDVKAD